MKGIVLAGGNGTRLSPTTLAINKHFFPVYDKPMIYYPLSTLLLADITDILIICKDKDKPFFKSLLHDGSQWGIKLSFAPQNNAKGIADAFIIGADFIGNQHVCLILGDNIFHGHQLQKTLTVAKTNKDCCSLFLYSVSKPENYGVPVYDNNNTIIDIEEKPISPKSNMAITGLYMYPPDVVSIAKSLKPSHRNELEITDLNRLYLKQKRLSAYYLRRGYTWFDAGNYQCLNDASQYISLIEKRQGQKVMCPEEIAWRQGYIDDKQLLRLSLTNQSSAYSQYLKQLSYLAINQEPIPCEC